MIKGLIMKILNLASGEKCDLQCAAINKILVKKNLLRKSLSLKNIFLLHIFLLFRATLYSANKSRVCNSEIDVRIELPSFCWHKWIYVAPSISHMASLWWHAIRVSPLETYSAANFAMSLLLSRRYSVFGKLLKRRHKSVVDGDRRSGNIFESNRGQFADVYSARAKITPTKRKENSISATRGWNR